MLTLVSRKYLTQFLETLYLEHIAQPELTCAIVTFSFIINRYINKHLSRYTRPVISYQTVAGKSS